MQCINCGSHLEPNWTHCPHCGKFKSVLKQMSAEDIDLVFEKLLGQAQKDVDKAKTLAAIAARTSGDNQPPLSADKTSTVRQQVFEVIVRQAIAGAPWREMCAGPMTVNSITEDEILEEVERRRNASNPRPSKADKEKRVTPRKDEEFKSEHPARPFFETEQPSSPSMRLDKLQRRLEDFLEKAIEDEQQRKYSKKLILELNEIANSVIRLEALVGTIRSEIAVNVDLERELSRKAKPFEPPDQSGGPHRVDW